jgi:hypothetical protein
LRLSIPPPMRAGEASPEAIRDSAEVRTAYLGDAEGA